MARIALVTVKTGQDGSNLAEFLSQMFGNTSQCRLDDDTPFRPRSAYCVYKLAGYHLTCNLGESYRIRPILLCLDTSGEGLDTLVS